MNHRNKTQQGIEMSRDTTHDEAHRESLVLAYERKARALERGRLGSSKEIRDYYNALSEQTQREINSIFELLGEPVTLQEVSEDELLAELGL